VKLFRPVGLGELDLIANSGFRAFPPRLSWQPIFYPVLTQDYARSIIRNWNSREADAGHCGFITEFDVEDAFSSRYPVRHLGGGPAFRELWVPAEELEEFNRHILGTIRVVESIYGERFSGELDDATGLPVSVVRAASAAGSIGQGTP
jgi:hypothetical protein